MCANDDFCVASDGEKKEEEKLNRSRFKVSSACSSKERRLWNKRQIENDVVFFFFPHMRAVALADDGDGEDDPFHVCQVQFEYDTSFLPSP